MGLVFDSAHGIFMLPDYPAFRSALESAAPPTRHQAAVALDDLRGSDIHYTVWLRARERSPAGLERLVRAALRDEEFSVEPDLEPLLRKYKGDQMRRPPEPGVTVV